MKKEEQSTPEVEPMESEKFARIASGNARPNHEEGKVRFQRQLG